MYYGIDDGHFSVKLINGKPLYFPARVLSGHYPFLSVNDEENNSFLYEVSGKKYTVIEKPALSGTLRFLETRTDDFPYSDINLVLAYHALIKAGVEGECHICTGLPFNQYYINNQKNIPLIEKKRESFSREVIACNAKVKPVIYTHKIASEGVAGYFDLKFNEDGSLNEEIEQLKQEGLICVIDIGGRTTEIVTLYDDNIDFNRSTTLDLGGLFLKDSVTEQLKVKMQTNSFPDSVIDQLIENDGKYVHTNPEKCIDAKDILDSVKLDMSNEIANHIRHNVGDSRDISALIFIGGGSLLLKKDLKSLYSTKIARFVKDPVHANARGMRKLVQFGG